MVRCLGDLQSAGSISTDHAKCMYQLQAVQSSVLALAYTVVPAQECQRHCSICQAFYSLLVPMQGFPSIGDLHSTVPVPKAKWFEYAGERSGRFQVRCCK